MLKKVTVLGAGHTKNLVAQSHFWLADYKQTTIKVNVYLTSKENTHIIRVQANLMSPPPLPVIPLSSCDERFCLTSSLWPLTSHASIINVIISWCHKFPLFYWHHKSDIPSHQGDTHGDTRHYIISRDQLTPRDKLALNALTQINNKHDNYTKSYRIVHQLNISFHQLFFQFQYI